MKRSKHSLSHYKLATFDMGQLVPVGLFEVLPGDSIQQATSALVRVSPLLAPVMHPVSVRIHHWFVPHRLVWDGWEDFITGGPDGAGGDAGAYPVIAPGGGFSFNSLPDYMGVPPGLNFGGISALPIRSYNLIYNEYYRDQDLCAEAGADDTNVLRVSWEKDYFSSARPWPQKGPGVTIPLGVMAPVKGIGKMTQVFPSANVNAYQSGDTTGPATYSNAALIGYTASPGAIPDEAWVAQQDPSNPGYPGIYADLTNATAANINDVRRAFAIQRYQEARAAYGSRYTEYLRYLGVRSSDARLQRPEYLGGGKQTISFSEVLRTGSVDDTAPAVVGELKGHGIAAMRSRRYRRFFEEHGVVLTLMSVRPRSMYVQGVNRLWGRRTKEDYWQKELELIGQQEVYNNEVFAGEDGLGSNIFGYQDRYAEYRHHPSSVAGEFRNTLNYWHMARDFAARPVLNKSFVECDPSKRIMAEQTQHGLWVMVNHSIKARRMVGKGVIGRII